MIFFMSSTFHKKRVFAVEVGMLRQEILVFVNVPAGEVRAEAKKIGVDDKAVADEIADAADNWSKKSRGVRGQFASLEIGQVIFLAIDRDKPTRGMSCLVHELTHAVHEICRKAGIAPCRESEEVYCYMAQDLFYQCMMKMQ